MIADDRLNRVIVQGTAEQILKIEEHANARFMALESGPVIKTCLATSARCPGTRRDETR